MKIQPRRRIQGVRQVCYYPVCREGNQVSEARRQLRRSPHGLVWVPPAWWGTHLLVGVPPPVIHLFSGGAWRPDSVLLPVRNRSPNPGLSPAFSHHLVGVPPACYPPVTRRTTPWKDGQRQRRIRCPCSSKTHRENAVHVARCLWHLFRRHVPLHLPSPPLTLHADFSFTFS